MRKIRKGDINRYGKWVIIGLPLPENKEGKLVWNYSLAPWMIETNHGRDFIFAREGKEAKIVPFKYVKSLVNHMFVRHVDDTTGDFKTSRFYLLDHTFVDNYDK